MIFKKNNYSKDLENNIKKAVIKEVEVTTYVIRLRNKYSSYRHEKGILLEYSNKDEAYEVYNLLVDNLGKHYIFKDGDAAIDLSAFYKIEIEESVTTKEIVEEYNGF